MAAKKNYTVLSDRKEKYRIKYVIQLLKKQDEGRLRPGVRAMIGLVY